MISKLSSKLTSFTISKRLKMITKGCSLKKCRFPTRYSWVLTRSPTSLCKMCINRYRNSSGYRIHSFCRPRQRVPLAVERLPPKIVYLRAIEWMVVSQTSFSRRDRLKSVFQISLLSLSIKCKQGRPWMWTEWMRCQWTWPCLCSTWPTTSMLSMSLTTRYPLQNLQFTRSKRRETGTLLSLIRPNNYLLLKLIFNRLISKVNWLLQ